MGKRRLTRQQKWRIQKVQEEKAQRLEKKAVRAGLDNNRPGAELKGLVISHFGTFVEVEPEGGKAAVKCHFRANVGTIVTGDWVVWRMGKEGYGIIEAVAPQTSLLSRPDIHGKLKPVASNIDFIVLVITPSPQPSSVLIDRYLVAASLQGLDAVILLNKTDLIDPSNQQEIASLLSVYEDIGYRTLKSSTKTEEGLIELKGTLANHTSVFVGQSGVGKTSLINSLLPGIKAPVAEISEGSQLGRHTTTNARLFHFPAGGCLIDSPGIREFGLWHLDPDELIGGFRDFQPFLGLCKFRDCKHLSEPGCALKAAAEADKVNPRRLSNYFAILKSIS